MKKRFLVVNVNWLGDVVFSTPIFRAIKEHDPDCHLACLAVPRVKEVLECCPFLDEVILYDERGKDRGLFPKLRLIWQLRTGKFDAVFLLHRSWTRSLLVFLAGIPRRVGYPDKGRGWLLTDRISRSLRPMHRSDQYLKIIEDFGIAVRDRHYQLNVDETAKMAVQSILRQQQITDRERLIVIHPGGNWDLKRWPVAHYRDLISQLTAESYFVILTGAKKEQTLVEQIVKDLPQSPLVLTGKISLKETIALMQQAKLVISGDSGPLHLASAVGTRTIGIFGPTRPELTGARGMGEATVLQRDVGCNRASCYYLDCPDNVCMQAIKPADVLMQVRKFVGQQARSNV